MPNEHINGASVPAIAPVRPERKGPIGFPGTLAVVPKGTMSKLPTSEQIRDTMPLAVLLGVELLEASSEIVRGRLEWAPERCAVRGLLHGGALMALADSCGGVCAFLNLPAGSIGTATIESNTSFMRPSATAPYWPARGRCARVAR